MRTRGATFLDLGASHLVARLGTSREEFFTIHKPGNLTEIRQYIIAAAYLLGCFRDLPALGGIEMVKLAYKVSGENGWRQTSLPL